MKALLSVGILVVATALAGCAPQQLTKADVDGRIICNSDQMDQVERNARRLGSQVQWVHCPQVTLRAV